MSSRIAYRTLAPDALEALKGLSQYVAQCDLALPLKHLVEIRVSQINGCAY